MSYFIQPRTKTRTLTASNCELKIGPFYNKESIVSWANKLNLNIANQEMIKPTHIVLSGKDEDERIFKINDLDFGEICKLELIITELVNPKYVSLT